MIRWYDYLAAFLIADVVTMFFFTIPIFGAFFGYVIINFGWDAYCQYRLEIEQ